MTDALGPSATPSGFHVPQKHAAGDPRAQLVCVLDQPSLWPQRGASRPLHSPQIHYPLRLHAQPPPLLVEVVVEAALGAYAQRA